MCYFFSPYWPFSRTRFEPARWVCYKSPFPYSLSGYHAPTIAVLQNGDAYANLSRTMAFLSRFLHSGSEHFFLLGPRGTGKTLWTQHQFPAALRVDLLDPETHRQLAARPER